MGMRTNMGTTTARNAALRTGKDTGIFIRMATTT